MPHKQDSKHTVGGMGAGATVGAMVGGPAGALAGGLLGGLVGYQKDTDGDQ
jgi:hypothetical protein